MEERKLVNDLRDHYMFVSLNAGFLLFDQIIPYKVLFIKLTHIQLKHFKCIKLKIGEM